MKGENMKNKLFVIYGVWKLFFFTYYISLDVIYFMTVFCDFIISIRCFFYMYLQCIMEACNELLYIFVLSLLRDHVIILKSKINDMDYTSIQNVKIIIHALMELKGSFQLINKYFSMLLLVKLSNSFASILLAVSIMIDSKKQGNLSFAELFYTGGWIAIMSFDVLIYFYCVDRCFVEVRLNQIL